MGRQLSRLESEYVLSEMAASKPPLEVSLLQGQLSAATTHALCGPQFYEYNPNSMSFFFDEAFIKKANLPHGVPCRFCFFYKTRRICFTASFSFVNGKSFCRAKSLFYADDNSSFLPSPRGNLLFASDALLGVLSLLVHRNFPLNTANKDERKTRFLGFAESAAGQTAFRELEAAGSLDSIAKSAILFYLDCEEALASLSFAAAAAFLQRARHPFWRAGKEDKEEPLDRAALINKIAELNGAPQQATISLKFDMRSIKAEGKALVSAFSDNLLLCNISLLSLEMENVRFIYEMSHGKKYAGP